MTYGDSWTPWWASQENFDLWSVNFGQSTRLTLQQLSSFSKCHTLNIHTTCTLYMKSTLTSCGNCIQNLPQLWILSPTLSPGVYRPWSVPWRRLMELMMPVMKHGQPGKVRSSGPKSWVLRFCLTVFSKTDVSKTVHCKYMVFMGNVFILLYLLPKNYCGCSQGSSPWLKSEWRRQLSRRNLNGYVSNIVCCICYI